MNGPDQSPLPRIFGDPNGAHWSVDPPPGWVESEQLDFTVTGDVIRFMWDYGVEVPLWTEDGLVPSEPEWLRTALGLSDPLIRDLADWGRVMNELDGRAVVREGSYRNLDRQAVELMARLRDELDPRFTVVYKPWIVVYDRGDDAIAWVDVRAAVDAVLADVRATTNVTFDPTLTPGSSEEWVMIMVAGPGSDVSGFDVRVDEDLSELLVQVAGQVQELVVEELAASRESNWPRCPHHRTSHPLDPRVVDERAVWACPVDGVAVTAVGDLTR